MPAADKRGKASGAGAAGAAATATSGVAAGRAVAGATAASSTSADAAYDLLPTLPSCMPDARTFLHADPLVAAYECDVLYATERAAARRARRLVASSRAVGAHDGVRLDDDDDTERAARAEDVACKLVCELDDVVSHAADSATAAMTMTMSTWRTVDGCDDVQPPTAATSDGGEAVALAFARCLPHDAVFVHEASERAAAECFCAELVHDIVQRSATRYATRELDRLQYGYTAVSLWHELRHAVAHAYVAVDMTPDADACTCRAAAQRGRVHDAQCALQLQQRYDACLQDDVPLASATMLQSAAARLSATAAAAVVTSPSTQLTGGMYASAVAPSPSSPLSLLPRPCTAAAMTTTTTTSSLLSPSSRGVDAMRARRALSVSADNIRDVTAVAAAAHVQATPSSSSSSPLSSRWHAPLSQPPPQPSLLLSSSSPARRASTGAGAPPPRVPIDAYCRYVMDVAVAHERQPSQTHAPRAKNNTNNNNKASSDGNAGVMTASTARAQRRTAPMPSTSPQPPQAATRAGKTQRLQRSVDGTAAAADTTTTTMSAQPPTRPRRLSRTVRAAVTSTTTRVHDSERARVTGRDTAALATGQRASPPRASHTTPASLHGDDAAAVSASRDALRTALQHIPAAYFTSPVCPWSRTTASTQQQQIQQQQLPQPAGGVLDVEHDTIVTQHSVTREAVRRNAASRRPRRAAPPPSSPSVSSTPAVRAHVTSNNNNIAVASSSTGGGGSGRGVAAGATLPFRVVDMDAASNNNGGSKDEECGAATTTMAQRQQSHTDRPGVSLLLSSSSPSARTRVRRPGDAASARNDNDDNNDDAAADRHNDNTRTAATATRRRAAQQPPDGDARGGDAAPLEQHVELQPLPGVVVYRPAVGAAPSATTAHARSKMKAVMVADGGGFVPPTGKQRWNDVRVTGGAGGGDAATAVTATATRSGSSRATSVALRTVSRPSMTLPQLRPTTTTTVAATAPPTRTRTSG